MGDGDDLTPFADGWDVLIETRRVQHRFEVAMDQCLEGLGLSYAQYRALELLLAAKQMHVSELARRLMPDPAGGERDRREARSRRVPPPAP